MKRESHNVRRRALGAGFAVAMLAAVAGADEGVIEMGEAQFMNRCAICHGMDGEGAGPYGAMLIVEPSDLTVLARNNDGKFPFGRVYDVIDGRAAVASHGPRSMPVWGRLWSDTDDIGAETLVRGRIVELILYLRSIQR